MADLDDFLTDLRVQLERCADDAAARERRTAAAARRRSLQRPPLRRALALAAALATGLTALAVGVVLTRPDGTQVPSSVAALLAPPGGGSATVQSTPLPSLSSTTSGAATATSYELAAVAASSATDAWAVGAAGAGQTAGATAPTAASGTSLALHFDGVSWRAVPTPSVGPLVAVTAPVVGQAWALASSGAVLHWDGAMWSLVPAAGPSGAHLRGITALGPNDIWVVGDLDGRPFAEQFDGAVWRLAALPVTSGAGSLERGGTLAAVTATRPDDVWAVGAADDGELEPLVLHYDGTHWTDVTAGDGLAPGAGALQMVTAAGNDVWAAGQSLLVRWDGEQWRRVSGAPPGPYAALASPGSSGLWLATRQGLSVWDGAGWRNVDTAGLGLPASTRLSVAGLSAGDPAGVWVAGAVGAGQTPLIAHWNGVDWQVAGASAGSR